MRLRLHNDFPVGVCPPTPRGGNMNGICANTCNTHDDCPMFNEKCCTTACGGKSCTITGNSISWIHVIHNLGVQWTMNAWKI